MEITPIYISCQRCGVYRQLRGGDFLIGDLRNGSEACWLECTRCNNRSLIQRQIPTPRSRGISNSNVEDRVSGRCGCRFVDERNMGRRRRIPPAPAHAVAEDDEGRRGVPRHFMSGALLTPEDRIGLRERYHRGRTRAETGNDKRGISQMRLRGREDAGIGEHDGNGPKRTAPDVILAEVEVDRAHGAVEEKGQPEETKGALRKGILKQPVGDSRSLDRVQNGRRPRLKKRVSFQNEEEETSGQSDGSAKHANVVDEEDGDSAANEPALLGVDDLSQAIRADTNQNARRGLKEAVGSSALDEGIKVKDNVNDTVPRLLQGAPDRSDQNLRPGNTPSTSEMDDQQRPGIERKKTSPQKLSTKPNIPRLQHDLLHTHQPWCDGACNDTTHLISSRNNCKTCRRHFAQPLHASLKCKRMPNCRTFLHCMSKPAASGKLSKGSGEHALRAGFADAYVCGLKGYLSIEMYLAWLRREDVSGHVLSQWLSDGIFQRSLKKGVGTWRDGCEVTVPSLRDEQIAFLEEYRKQCLKTDELWTSLAASAAASGRELDLEFLRLSVERWSRSASKSSHA